MSQVEARAQVCRRDGVQGYYVVQPRMGIAVAGPYDLHSDAQREATARNTSLPHPPPPDPLEVRLLGPDRVWP